MNVATKVALPIAATAAATGIGMGSSGLFPDDGLELPEAAGTVGVAIGVSTLMASLAANPGVGNRLSVGLGTAGVILGASLGANLLSD